MYHRTTSVDDVIGQMRTNSEIFLDRIESEFELGFAKTLLVTATQQAQLEDNRKSTDQVKYNKMTTTIVNGQLERYKNEYNDLPNKMRHYG